MASSRNLLALVSAVICLNSFLIISSSDDFQECPDEKTCLCDRNRIECYCNGTENITIISFLQHRAEKVILNGCNRVQLHIGALANMALKELTFMNINELFIDSFSMSGDHPSDYILFKNIAYLQIGQFGIIGIQSVKSFIFENVTIKNFFEFAITLKEIEMFSIRDSKILNMEILSIHLSNVTRFSIEQSHIEFTSNVSMVIRNTQSVVFHKCSFNYLTEDSFYIPSSDTIMITNCTFVNIPAQFIWGKGNLFSFEGNTVTNSNEPDAFKKIQNNIIVFRDNHFQRVFEDSILPNPNANISYKDTQFFLRNNSFYCDCHLSWLFNESEFYADIIESSSCNNYPDLKLSTLNNFFETKSMCVYPTNEFISPKMMMNSPFRLNLYKKNKRGNASTILKPQFLYLLLLIFIEFLFLLL